MIQMPGRDDLSSTAALDLVPDGVYLTDTDRRILFWNRGAEEITGWKRSRVVGHCCRDNILCHVDKDGHQLCGQEYCPLHRSMITGQQSDAPILVFAQRADGSRVPVEVMVSPVKDDTGKVVGGIEIFRDMSAYCEDLERAHLIQLSTVGLALPEDPRYRLSVQYTPRDLVGGDFYRAEVLACGTVVMFLADVVGHGIPAALYAMQLRVLWEEGKTRCLEPAAFLAWMSRRTEALTTTGTGYFATGLAAAYNPATGRLETCTAGHPSPLLLRYGDPRPEAMQAPGPGLGLLAHPRYQPASTILAPGDSALLFSDGAFEIPGPDGQDLGLEGFAEKAGKLAVQGDGSTLADLEEDLLKQAGTVTLPDDLTLLLLRRNPD